MKRKFLHYSAAIFFLATACATVQKTRDQAPPNTLIRFADGTKASGVAFTHSPDRSPEKWMPEVLGSGVATADFNRDGAPDILLVNSGRFGETQRGENARNRLFLNDGKGKFTDRTDAWNLAGNGYGFGVAVGDYDNDGLTDVFLTSFEGDNRLLRNTGEKFEDVTDKSGFKNEGKWTTSAGFADFDNDGDLDLFVVRYVIYSKANNQQAYRNGLMIYSAPFLYDPVPDQLWRNDGNGRFTDVSESSGIAASPQKGLALAIGDIDKDGDQDVYVANDTTPNQLWINDGTGKFKDIARLAGCAYSEAGKEEGSMGADFSDFDLNGFLDIVVTNFQAEPTGMYSQNQPLLFREVSDAIGIGESSRQRLSFGIDFFDADNDGDEDLIAANGHIEDNIDQNSDSVTFEQQNSLYENTGKGTFVDISNSAGEALADKQASRGLAVADLDGDGDLDFVVSNNGGTAQVAFNETTDKGNFAGIWLEGEKGNRSAIGARVLAKIGEKTIERQVMGAQSYLSVSDFRLLFGLGPAEKIDQLTIFWPGGEQQSINDLTAGKYYYIRQTSDPVAFTPGAFKP